MIAEQETIALETLRSASPFILVGPDNSLISEHSSTPEAVRAAAKYLAEEGAEAHVYRRTRTAWVKY